MKTMRFFFLLVTGLVCSHFSFAQKKDSAGLRVMSMGELGAKRVAADSTGKKKHDPHKATMHSLILPGWGQAYNRSYWKIPLVYAALGITGYVFNYNRIQYNHAKYAYFYVVNKAAPDTAGFRLNNITDPALKNFAIAGDSYTLQTYRNESRKYVDYSVLYFLFFWALNVVDATVDGHLKDFDVSNDLSIKIKPAINALPNTIGVSVVVDIGKHPPKHAAWQMP